MFKNLTEKGQTFIVAFIIAILTVSLAWVLSGWQLASLLAAISLVIVFIGRHLWRSDKSNFILRLTVLGIANITFLTVNSWLPNLLQTTLHNYFPKIPLPDNTTPLLVLPLVVALVAIVFHYTKETTQFAKTDKPIKDLIQGLTIKEKWKNVCNNLGKQIRDIDTDTNWESDFYTPLDAEVEIQTSNKTKKVVQDLLTAIKSSDDRLMLLIGDPGAGKSVALRKLCADILETSVKTEYIPIYINLKEWTSSDDWSVKPPTVRDLEAFVRQKLSVRSQYLADFFDAHYKTLDENGNLFFVLDSFDEIPQVLGTTAESKLIDDLTKVCSDFLVGAKEKRSRGILASREYRMPSSDYLDANTLLRVRPFTHEKIEDALTKRNKVTNETVQRIFKERRDLIPILRNPFITSLLHNYLVDNNQQFPQNQADLFSSYVEKSIDKAIRRLVKPHISVEEVEAVAIKMATIIFSQSGLQAPLSMLRQQVPHPHFDDIIQVLRFTRIARGDMAGTNTFSYAHRRFYEYFVVKELIQKGVLDLPLDSIPTDSKWRDTLVLYCEVAPFKEAQRIANYCWFGVICPKLNLKNRATKH